MIKKFRSNSRLQFLSIAVSIAVLSSILGLAAYLTNQTEPLTAIFKMRYGDKFGIGISSDNYYDNTEIIPGGTAAFDPKITNNGNYDVYVFMEVSLPDKSFSLSKIGSDWHLLTSTEDKIVYYYGSSYGLHLRKRVRHINCMNFTASYQKPSGISLKAALGMELFFKSHLFTFSFVALLPDLFHVNP